MKLWGGRFTKETNELVNNFNASISFDQKFYKQDIQGSIAHATMLAAQGIISEDEGKQITDGLKGILSDIESGKLEITDEYEDIHTFMEATLIERIGDAGKKLHTGRSRNDQVALDMRLYTRDEVKNVDEEVRELMEVILRIIKENVDIGLTKKRYFKILKNFLGIKILLSLTIGLLICMTVIIYVLIMYLYLHNNAVVAILWTLYTISVPIFSGIFTSLTVVVDFAVISSMYYKYSNNNDDTFSKKEKRKEYRLLAFVAKGKGIFKFLIVIGSLLTVLVIFLVSYVIFDSNIYDELYSKIEVTAHRGNSTVTMPNTIPAFKEAIKEGADYGELDVRQTKDNVIVVTHDASLKEMTGQDINVRDLTYEELQKIPCIEVNGNKCTVPKLEDVINVCKGKIKLNIEIKTGNNDSEDFVSDVVKIIENTDFVDKCVVTSLDYRALRKVKECNPKIKTGYIMAVAMGEFYDLPCVDFFSMETTFVNGRVVERAHKLNKEIHVWTVNDEDSLKKCVELEVDNIITDNVAGAKSAIATHGDDVFSIVLNQLKESDNSKENIKKTNRILEDVTGIEGA